MFTADVKLVLTQMGWSPTRRIDISRWRSELLEQGVFLSERAQEILEQFGGLTLSSPECKPAGTYRVGKTTFNPLIALDEDEEHVRRCEKLLGTRLSPLGEYYDQAFFYIADDGRIVATWSGELWLLGTSFEDALENTIVFGRRTPPTLATWDDDDD